MPTGYTSEIANGQTFEEFVWGCARAFGALIMMRDEPANAPIPEFQPSDYDRQRLTEHAAELNALMLMTPEQIAAAALKDYERQYKEVEKWNKGKDALHLKYTTMLSRVDAWNPPTEEHKGLKKFMAQQIQGSIDFDCRLSELPEPMQPKAWHELKIQSLKRAIAYNEEAQREEIERTNNRNKWVKDLAASVPMPAILKTKQQEVA